MARPADPRDVAHVGAVASGHEESARAGAEVLAEGGNAADAAVAAAFVACTGEPTLTGLGGAGFATVYLADGTGHAVDFFASVPGIGRTVEIAGQPVPVDVLFGATTQTFHVGPQSCAVPGFVKGVLHVHERFGRLPLERVLEPGIRLARHGLRLPPQQAYCHHLLTPVLTRTARGRDVFAPRGPMLAAGDLFRQPDLAGSLELLAAGGEAVMYRGELARELVRWSDEDHGLLTAADLAGYEVVEAAPIRAPWQDLEYVAVPPPSSGGALVAFALLLLDRATGGADVDLDTAAGADLIARVMVACDGMRGSEFDAHLYGGDLAAWLLGEEALRRGDGLVAAADGADPQAPASSRLGSTTQLSVIDREGNAVSMTTSTGCGSGEFAGRTGIHMNNMLGEEDLAPVEHVLRPGERLTSMMAPALLLHEGRPVLATGSAGSSRLRGAIVQSLARVAAGGDEQRRGTHLQRQLERAVQAPRLHAEAGLVQLEPGWPEAVVQGLEQRGHRLNLWPTTNMYFGGVNVAAAEAEAAGTERAPRFAAAGDHRRGGGGWIAYADGHVEQA